MGWLHLQGLFLVNDNIEINNISDEKKKKKEKIFKNSSKDIHNYNTWVLQHIKFKVPNLHHWIVQESHGLKN